MPCQACRRNVPTKYFEFYQGIGMLVLRTTRSVKGNLCGRCAKKYFWELNSLTLLTGWWGIISFITNIFYIVNNVSRFFSALSLPDSGDQAFPVQTGPAAPGAPALPGPVPPTLTAYRQDIILRLHGGQTPQEIAQFIAPRAGVNLPLAQQYVYAVHTGKA